MRKIPITRGLVAIVDDADYDAISRFPWFAKRAQNQLGCFYACRTVPIGDGRNRSLWMHREIMGIPRNCGIFVDHIDQNGLHNWRANLREASISQNNANRRTIRAFRGVHAIRGGRRWQAKIQIDNHQRHLGYFDTPELAASAYDAAAIELFGEFARLNFPDTPRAAA